MEATRPRAPSASLRGLRIALWRPSRPPCPKIRGSHGDTAGSSERRSSILSSLSLLRRAGGGGCPRAPAVPSLVCRATCSRSAGAALRPFPTAVLHSRQGAPGVPLDQKAILKDLPHHSGSLLTCPTFTLTRVTEPHPVSPNTCRAEMRVGEGVRPFAAGEQGREGNREGPKPYGGGGCRAVDPRRKAGVGRLRAPPPCGSPLTVARDLVLPLRGTRGGAELQVDSQRVAQGQGQAEGAPHLARARPSGGLTSGWGRPGHGPAILPLPRPLPPSSARLCSACLPACLPKTAGLFPTAEGATVQRLALQPGGRIRGLDLSSKFLQGDRF